MANDVISTCAFSLRNFASTPPRLPAQNLDTLQVTNAANMQTTKNISLQPRISEGEDEFQVKKDLEALVENGWELNEEQIQLERTYYFKTYTKVMVSYQL
jgi:hypothetical protein